MMPPQPDQNEWGRDPLSAEIDKQIAGMPDRSPTILALMSYNIGSDSKNRDALAPFRMNLFREIPLDCYGRKLTVTFFGFDLKDADAFMHLINVLPTLGFDEAAIYRDGVPVLRITKLKRVPPRPDTLTPQS